MITRVKSLITRTLKGNKKLVIKMLIILFFGISLLPQQSFLVNDTAVASEGDGKTESQIQREKLISMTTFMEAISQIGFVIIWPLVALAGLAMDNTLIYGSFMNLDIPLWKIWQIVRNFANYALGLIFLVCILIYNFSPSGKMGTNAIKNPGELIKKTLIASVLIQASWFLFMVLVDLSTILTYSVGGLPGMVFNESLGGGAGDDTKMFMMNTEVNLGNYNELTDNNGDVPDSVIYYWDFSGGHIAPCETAKISFGGNEGSQTFVIGRKFASLSSGRDMKEGYCMYYGSLISYNDFFSATSQTGYLTRLKGFKSEIESNTSLLTGLVNAGIIYPVSAGKIPYFSGVNTSPLEDEQRLVGSGIIDGGYQNRNGCRNSSGGNMQLGVISPVQSGGKYDCLYANEYTDISISNILKKAGSMTGPFSALYANMATYSHLDTAGLGIWQKFVVALVNTGFAILLVLPLCALVIVLFARIGILWIAIALSPFLVLINVFKGLMPKMNFIDKYLTFEELVKLLLAPVLISFAVGISLIFMKALQGSIGTGIGAYKIEGEAKNQMAESISRISGMKYDPENGNLDLLSFIRIKMNSALLNLSRMLTMLFGLGVTWFLLFWAIRQTNIGKSIGDTLKKFGETTLLTRPIIPIGKNGLSIGALQNAPDTILTNVSTKMKTRSDANLNNLISGDRDTGNKGKKGSTSKPVVNYTNNATSYYESGDFDTAFGIQASDYSNTKEMIDRMNSLYGVKPENRGDKNPASIYASMIQSAKDPGSLESIVANMNTNKITTEDIEPGIETTIDDIGYIVDRVDNQWQLRESS